MGLQVIRFEGSISGARFASGDTIVVGAWRSSPFGSFADVMWSAADGRRALLAGDERVLEFVGLLGPALGPMGSVRTRGRTADGAREWYAVHDFLPATRVHGSIDGEDLGTTVEGDEADAFGFSAFPARAGTVRVTSMIEADGPRALREVAR